jgi:hypothetical protein
MISIERLIFEIIETNEEAILKLIPSDEMKVNIQSLKELRLSLVKEQETEISSVATYPVTNYGEID